MLPPLLRMSKSWRQRFSILKPKAHSIRFFALPPNNERFVLDSVKCENGHCEITGEYDGSETELSRVIEALEQEPWWEFGSPIITTQVAQRGLKLNVSFAASHSPNARVRYRNSTQAD